MARRKVGKISTETMILGGIVLLGVVYIATRPRTVPVNPIASSLITTPGGGTYYLPGNQTAQDINAAGGAASNVINSLNNAGIFG